MHVQTVMHYEGIRDCHEEKWWIQGIPLRNLYLFWDLSATVDLFTIHVQSEGSLLYTLSETEKGSLHLSASGKWALTILESSQNHNPLFLLLAIHSEYPCIHKHCLVNLILQKLKYILIIPIHILMRKILIIEDVWFDQKQTHYY